MEQKSKEEILNIMKVIFEDAEYEKALMYLRTERFNELRCMASEKYDLFDAIMEVSVNPVIELQRNLADRLEDLVINAFLGEKV
jgi:hypothetical protein